MANERTFLAWVRTALGLVGLGVLLERLGAGGAGVAVAAGVGFISFGGLCLIYAVSRYLWVAKHLERGMFPVAIRGPVVIAFGALLVAAGAMLYVLLVNSSEPAFLDPGVQHWHDKQRQQDRAHPPD